MSHCVSKFSNPNFDFSSEMHLKINVMHRPRSVTTRGLTCRRRKIYKSSCNHEKYCVLLSFYVLNSCHVKLILAREGAKWTLVVSLVWGGKTMVFRLGHFDLRTFAYLELQSCEGRTAKGRTCEDATAKREDA